jgi:hypothetical protein
MAAGRVWDAVCAEVRRQRPEVLVLSSEYLLYGTEASHKVRLAKLLRELSDDIVPVIYVRHPVELYRSLLQQFLKHRDGPYPPKTEPLKPQILATEAAFGRRPELVAFDRSVLHQGDIVWDFATRFLAGQVDPASLPSLNENVGLSAEALILLVRLRAGAGARHGTAHRAAGLVRTLRALDQGDPPEKSMSLLPEVAEAALRSAIGYRWLSETGQLHIPRLDIDQIDGAAPPPWMETAQAETLFFHDPERLERLGRAMDRQLTNAARPSGRDRVLRFLLGKPAPNGQLGTATHRGK